MILQRRRPPPREPKFPHARICPRGRSLNLGRLTGVEQDKKRIDIWKQCNTIHSMSDKRVFNLRLEADLVSEIKIQAVRENRSVSEIVTELIREYLRKAKAKK